MLPGLIFVGWMGLKKLGLDCVMLLSKLRHTLAYL